MTVERDFIFTNEAKDILGVSRKRVVDYIKDGKISAYQLGNKGPWRIDEQSVRDFLEGCKRGCNETHTG